MDENDALVPFGLEGNAVIHEYHLRNRGEVGKEIAWIWSLVHGRIGCLRLAGEKSGQVLVRTLGAKNQARCGWDVSSASTFLRHVQLLKPEDTATMQKEMACSA